MFEHDASTPAPARLAVGLVSAGRVGTAMGRALERRGHVVSSVVAPSAASRERAADAFPEAHVASAVEVASRSEMLVLAVPDSALPKVVAELAAADVIGPGHIVVHTAGALGWSVLRPFWSAGAVVVAAHPAMTFTGARSDAERLDGCSWAVTAPDEVGLAVGQMLVMETGGTPVVVDESCRALYHAALAHGANHLVTLVNDSVQALAAALVARPGQGPATGPDGLALADPQGTAAEMIAPLLRAALDNALTSGDAALTGPVMRGDAATVSRHLDVLEDLDGEVAAGYRALALRTAARSGAGRDITDLLAPDLTEQLR